MTNTGEERPTSNARDEQTGQKNIGDLSEMEPGDLESGKSFNHRENELPVDRGWAWVICFAGFLVSFTFGTAQLTLAVLFLEVMDMFNTTLTTASLIFLFRILGMGCMTSFSTNIIVPKIGEKGVVCISGLVSAISFVGFYFSTNIEIFLVCSALQGLCNGAAFVPSVSLLRHYFHRRRSIANIIARGGASMSAILAPPLVRVVRWEFGVKGSFLICAAVQLHIVLAGLLLRSDKSYRFRPELPPLPNQRKRKGDKTEQKEGAAETTEAKSGAELLPMLTSPHAKDEVSQDANSYEKNTNISSNGLDKTFGKVNLPHGSEDSVQQIISSMGNNQRTLFRENLCRPGSESVVCDDKNLSEAEAEDRKDCYDCKTTTSSLGRADMDEKNDVEMALLKTVNNHLCDTGTNGQMLNKQSIRTTREADNADLSEAVVFELEEREKDTQAEQESSAGCGRYDFCRSWAFYTFLAFTPLGAANMYLRNYIPTIAASQGATLDEAATLMTFLGVLDLLSRLALGFFADCHLLKPSQIVVVAQAALGVTCHLIQFFNSFSALVVMAVLIGAFVGTKVSMTPMMCIEIVGVETMPQALGLISTIATFSAAAMNPALGAVADSDGSFVPVMHILGVLLILSTAMLLLLPLGRRLDKRKES
ncbi:monocarboxylate transporter [Plakobranchus ocellatus]|uniref:Monocarboxylate transporter n=1 Tax=Plakobranchus ocellatus TaxID=259542 RepID=A0AAV3Y286_9GAST|nr:monocarboxylate transporter [Plakobranchus ocellatus]